MYFKIIKITKKALPQIVNSALYLLFLETYLTIIRFTFPYCRLPSLIM